MQFLASFQNFSKPGKGQERVFSHSPEGQNEVLRHLRKLQTGKGAPENMSAGGRHWPPGWAAGFLLSRRARYLSLVCDEHLGCPYWSHPD